MKSRRRLVLALPCAIAAVGVLYFALAPKTKPAQIRTLTFAERVAYQRAIEEVYWGHRLWPNEHAPKPSLNEVMSQAQIEKKVTDYLRNSQALEDYWQRPLTAEQLQAEMDRMAQHTKQPEVLRELFAALGNDPFIIAECLARPALVERLAASWYGHDESWRNGADTQMPVSSVAQGANYTLPTLPDAPNACTDDTWTPTSISNVPWARIYHTAVWTGSEMIVWGGFDNSTPYLNTGGRYDPSTDSWTATSIINAPSARANHAAVWTGSEMIIWGGFDGRFFRSGGSYNPATNNWTSTSTTNVPTGREYPTAVWSGSEMIIWGGWNGSAPLNSAGRYNPGTNSWTATSTTNAPAARFLHTAVWTGNEMVVWGGWDNGTNYFNTGGRYNPGTNSWTATAIANAPSGRSGHTAVWSGSEMIVWGGANASDFFNTGGSTMPAPIVGQLPAPRMRRRNEPITRQSGLAVK